MISTDPQPARDAPVPASVDRIPSGPLLFARYAYPPNALGYCGGDEPTSLSDHCAAAVDDDELVARCREFAGAWPYLELIAGSAGIRDPLDPRVVEAYWIGNAWLDEVQPRAFADSLDDRFKTRTARSEWPWLSSKPASGARPHHSFHVLEVFPRVGLLRDGHVQDVVERMERCLIRPARVIGLDGSGVRVMARGLELHDGHLRFTEPRLERLDGWVDGTAAGAPAAGDWVTTHWGWACERIGPHERARLVGATRDALRLANRTI